MLEQYQRYQFLLSQTEEIALRMQHEFVQQQPVSNSILLLCSNELILVITVTLLITFYLRRPFTCKQITFSRPHVLRCEQSLQFKKQNDSTNIGTTICLLLYTASNYPSCGHIFLCNLLVFIPISALGSLKSWKVGAGFNVLRTP